MLPATLNESRTEYWSSHPVSVEEVERSLSDIPLDRRPDDGDCRAAPRVRRKILGRFPAMRRVGCVLGTPLRDADDQKRHVVVQRR